MQQILTFLATFITLVNCDFGLRNQTEQQQHYVTNSSLSAPVHYSNGSAESRIINGVDAKPGQFPYVVGLVFKDNHGSLGYCGGALVGPYTVITVENCIKNVEDQEVYKGKNVGPDVQIVVYINTVDISAGYKPGAPNSRIALKKKIVYHYYLAVHGNFDYGIALVFLEEPVYDVQYMPLPPEDAPLYEDYVGDFAGWGQRSANDWTHYSLSQLQTTKMQIMQSPWCPQPYINFLKFCVHSRTTNVCGRDNGGPLILNGVGLGLSWHDYQNCQPVNGVYTSVFLRISPVVVYIKHHMQRYEEIIKEHQQG